MNEEHGQESETERVWGVEGEQDLRNYANGGNNVARISEGVGNQRVTLNRKNSEAGVGFGSAIGGILDQLIDDAEKQLVKSRECIVWYREEVKQYEEKLNNLRKLKELQQQQQAQELSNNHGEGSLVE
jgi:hypothetical protein